MKEKEVYEIEYSLRDHTRIIGWKPIGFYERSGEFHPMRYTASELTFIANNRISEFRVRTVRDEVSS